MACTLHCCKSQKEIFCVASFYRLLQNTYYSCENFNPHTVQNFQQDSEGSGISINQKLELQSLRGGGSCTYISAAWISFLLFVSRNINPNPKPVQIAFSIGSVFGVTTHHKNRMMVYTHACAHTHTHTHTHTHAHAHIPHTQSHKHIPHTQIHKHTQTHTHITHTNTHTHTHTHTVSNLTKIL